MCFVSSESGLFGSYLRGVTGPQAKGNDGGKGVGKKGSIQNSNGCKRIERGGLWFVQCCLAVEKHGKCEQEGKTKMKQKLF